MAGLVDHYGTLGREARRRGRPPDAYGALLRSIVGQQIAGARVVVVAGAGHYVQVEKPRETTAAVREFMIRLRS